MPDSLYVRAWSAWAPGLEERMAWMTWALGEGEGPRSERSSPALPHVDGLFKRRLSQLSRMTMHVGHEVAEGGVNAKTTFCSVYGEIVQQYRISAKLVESGEVSPAAFSLSVFNTPVAALSIAESNVEGYTAVYPGIDAFAVGLMEAAASIATGREIERILIAADELLPDPFMALEGGANIPYALALRLGASGEPGAFALDLSEIERRPWRDASVPEALAFLRFMLA